MSLLFKTEVLQSLQPEQRKVVECFNELCELVEPQLFLARKLSETKKHSLTLNGLVTLLNELESENFPEQVKRELVARYIVATEILEPEMGFANRDAIKDSHEKLKKFAHDKNIDIPGMHNLNNAANVEALWYRVKSMEESSDYLQIIREFVSMVNGLVIDQNPSSYLRAMEDLDRTLESMKLGLQLMIRTIVAEKIAPFDVSEIT